MKRYVVKSWIDQTKNPFQEELLPILEAPVNQPIPGATDPGVGIPGASGSVPTPGRGPDIPPGDGQQGMEDMGEVEPTPSTDEIPDNMEPEDEEPMIDFETEKIDYMNLAVSQKNDEMMDKLLEMREIKQLSPGQYKFIEDNIQILSLARDVDFSDAQRKIYKQIKSSFEHLIPEEEVDVEVPEGETAPEETPTIQPSGDVPASYGQPTQRAIPPAADSVAGEPEPQSQPADFAHYDIRKNLKGVIFSEAPIDAVPLSGAFTPTGEVPGPDAIGGTTTAPVGDHGTGNLRPPGPADRTPSDQQPEPETPEKIGEIGDFEDNFETERPSGTGQVSGTELYSIISSEIEPYKTITDCLTKLPGFYSMKSDLFRKSIAAIANGVQIGSGGTLEDLFIPLAEDGVGIKVCTRCYTDFGNIQIGKWALQFNDPENFLSDAELKKLNDTGSPEEKEVLRKRVIVESIAESFKDKVYLCMIIDPNMGERHEIGFNFAELIRDGWKNGYISIEFKASVGQGDAGVKTDGELIDLQKIQINYVKESPDKLDEEGKPVKEYVEFMDVKNGFLYVTIMGDEFTNFANDAQAGLFYSSKPFDSGPEELLKIQRCVPDIKEILLRKC